MQSKPCCDPRDHPVPSDASTTSIYNLLNENSAGCGKVTGEDSMLATEIIPADTFAKFMAANVETMNANNIGTDLFNFYKSTNVAMRLYARDRIAVKCTAGCSTTKEFGFEASANVMFATMTAIWSSLKTLINIAGWGSLVCFLVLLYIIWLKSRAT